MSPNLNPRERRLLALAGVVLAALAGWTLVLQPSLEKVDRLDQSIAKHRADLATLQELTEEYDRVSNRIKALSGRAGIQKEGFSVDGYAENLIRKTGLKAHLDKLSPLPPEEASRGLTRAAVDIKLTAAPLSSVTKLLHELEHSAEPLAVTRFSLTSSAKGVDVSLRAEALVSGSKARGPAPKAAAPGS